MSDTAGEPTEEVTEDDSVKERVEELLEEHGTEADDEEVQSD